jgi:phosphoribosylformylglycinamidine cyclo-ligase
MYVPLVEGLLERGTDLHYLSHITGHGLLKLMRPAASLTYRITALPPVPPVLAFLAEQAALDARAAYSTFNMGAGFALYCAPGAAGEILALARELGYGAIIAGAVEEGPRRVVLEPLQIVYDGALLELS